MRCFFSLSVLPPALVRAVVSLPLMLLATGLWAAHHDHPTATDLAIQAMLLLFMVALLVNVIVSVVAILRERDAADQVDGRTRRFASKLETQRSARSAPTGATATTSEVSSERVPAKQALSEG